MDRDARIEMDRGLGEALDRVISDLEDLIFAYRQSAAITGDEKYLKMMSACIRAKGEIKLGAEKLWNE